MMCFNRSIQSVGVHVASALWKCLQPGSNGVKWSSFFLGANQGIKMDCEQLILTDHHVFSDTKELWLHVYVFVFW